jgi:glutamate-1-semialdehyde 2,1-aminomutase
MGGGLPAAAFGGRADVMAQLAPAGPVYQAGTLSGNPVAVAAGLAQLRAATPDIYPLVDAAATRVGDVVAAALDAAGVAYQRNAASNLFSFFFTESAVVDWTTAARQSTAAYAAFFASMLEHGVYLPPSGFEAWFVGSTHDDDAVAVVADAAAPAARAAAEALRG